LFSALGWDIGNTSKAIHLYRDVICEYSLRSWGKNGRTLSPDYAFRIGKDPVFVETKQPSKNLETDP
jgi:hypothetical protein